MLRSIYLVARRDYLGYVTAWGFWLGLLITPILFSVGMMVPAMAASSVPVRYFTLVDAGGEFHAAMVEELADRRDDASAHGHRMAALTSQLETAEQRLADLDRQKVRLEEDRGEADRLTRDAAEALARLAKDLAQNEKALADDEKERPALVRRAEDAERASRAAELALANATAELAGVEAEWRVVEAEIAQARARLDRIEAEIRRMAEQRAALSGRDGESEVEDAREAAESAATRLRSRPSTRRSGSPPMTSARFTAAAWPSKP